MKQTKAYILLLIFMSPFLLLIGFPIVDALTEVSIESVLWFIFGCLVLILWLMAGHYSLKYFHAKAVEHLDSKPQD